MERLILLTRIYSIPEQIKHIVLLTAIRGVLYSAINIFLPAYLVYSHDLRTAVLFMMLKYSFFFALISLKTYRNLIRRFPLEIIQILSLLIGVIGLVVLFLVNNWLGFVISAFLLNLQNTFYWLPKHYAIVKFANKNKKMEESVIIDNVGRIISFLTPIISSYIIYFLGYSLYYAVITFIIVSSLMYILNRIRSKRTYAFPDHGMDFRFTSLFILEGIVAGSWLITTTAFLFYSLSSDVISYGFMRTLGAVVTILLSFYIAKMIDSKHNLKMSLFSLVLLSFALFGFALFTSVPFLVSFFVVLISTLYALGSLSPMAFVYEYAKNEGVGILLGREFLQSIGRSIILFLSALSIDAVYLGALFVILYTMMFYVVVMRYKHLF